ncbi:MAG: Ada metal-binding domain-containing protein, partial [Myxococcota bacterium]
MPASSTSSNTCSHLAEDRWIAVVDRDASADGTFIYAVKTTGVYCRPSCPSRTALRKNVVFFEDIAAAVEAGFRPCKRCRPDEVFAADPAVGAVTKACRLIEQSEEMPSLAALAAAAGLSRYHFHRTFKKITGVTPRAFAAEYRASRVRDSLANGESVTTAIYEAG